MEEALSTGWRGLGALPWYVAGSQALGLACVVIVGVWLGQLRGGFAWDGSAQQFNVHPICMVLSLVFLNGDALLVYRIFRNENKRSVKIVHGLLHCIAFVVAIVGITAVFQFHASANIPHMYSLHSWCGMLAFVLYCVQWLMGLGFFMFPVVTEWLKVLYLPLHKFFGLALFGLSVASCLLGITEKLLFNIMADYPHFIPEGVLANTLGLLLVAFGVVVGFVVTQEDFKRPPNPEEEALSVHFKTLSEGGDPASP